MSNAATLFVFEAAAAGHCLALIVARITCWHSTNFASTRMKKTAGEGSTLLKRVRTFLEVQSVWSKRMSVVWSKADVAIAQAEVRF